jgi:hypothetical protein
MAIGVGSILRAACAEIQPTVISIPFIYNKLTSAGLAGRVPTTSTTIRARHSSNVLNVL